MMTGKQKGTYWAFDTFSLKSLKKSHSIGQCDDHSIIFLLTPYCVALDVECSW